MLDSQSAQLGKISNRWPFSELVVVKDSEYREWEKERGGDGVGGEKERWRREKQGREEKGGRRRREGEGRRVEEGIK